MSGRLMGQDRRRTRPEGKKTSIYKNVITERETEKKRQRKVEIKGIQRQREVIRGERAVQIKIDLGKHTQL